MKYVWRVVVLLFFVSLPVWYIPAIISDLQHPERWGNSLHDPRWYLPALAAVILVGFLLVAHMYRAEKNRSLRSALPKFGDHATP